MGNNKTNSNKAKLANFFWRILAVVLLILLAPLFFIISLLVIILSGCPVFFKQKRVGENGKVFTMWKWRTMPEGSDRKGADLLKMNETDGPAFKIYLDPRYTSIGRWLSHTGLDELPQLWNIAKGEMEFVGPRPLPVGEEKQISKEFREKRWQVKPGIISPWVLNGYHKLSFREWMESDMEYIRNKNWRSDVQWIMEGGIMAVKLVLRESRKM